MFVRGRENSGRESTFAQGFGPTTVDKLLSLQQRLDFAPSVRSIRLGGLAHGKQSRQDRHGKPFDSLCSLMINRAGLVNKGFGLSRPASGEISSFSAQDNLNLVVYHYGRRD